MIFDWLAQCFLRIQLCRFIVNIGSSARSGPTPLPAALTSGQCGAVDKVPEIKRQGRFQARKKMPFGITLSV